MPVRIMAAVILKKHKQQVLELWKECKEPETLRTLEEQINSEVFRKIRNNHQFYKYPNVPSVVLSIGWESHLKTKQDHDLIHGYV